VKLLAIGMAVAIAGSTARAIDEQWSSFRTACIMLAMLLMAAGYAVVAHQLAGWRRAVMSSVAGLTLGWLGWLIARPYVGPLDDLHYRAIAAVLWWSGIVLVTIAARAWWRPTSAWIAIAAVVAVVLEALPWAPYVGPAFNDTFSAYPTQPVRELVTSCALLVLVRGILR
jgi:hypothetical protein